MTHIDILRRKRELAAVAGPKRAAARDGAASSRDERARGRWGKAIGTVTTARAIATAREGPPGPAGTTQGTGTGTGTPAEDPTKKVSRAGVDVRARLAHVRNVGEKWLVSLSGRAYAWKSATISLFSPCLGEKEGVFLFSFFFC